MKRKDIQAMLEREAEKLDGRESFERILSRTSSLQSKARSGDVEVVALTHRRRDLAIVCIAALLILVIAAVSVGVVFAVTAAPFAGITYISISINPAVSMQVNERNKVVSVTALNDDAQLLLLGMDLVGMDYRSACLAVLSEADREQYLADGRDVNAIAVNDNHRREEEVRVNVQNTLNGYISENALSNNVFVNYFSGEAIDFAKRNNISAGRAQLLLEADALSDMSVSELSQLSYEELLLMVMGTSAGVSADFREELEERLDRLEEEFERKSEELEEKIEEIEDLFDDSDDFEHMTWQERERIKKVLKSIVNDPDVGVYFKDVIPQSEVQLDQKMRDMPAFARELEEFADNLEERFKDLEDDFEDRLEQIKDEYKRYSDR